MTWVHGGDVIEQLPDGIVGFIYVITNTTNGRKYIGKKKATFKKTAVKTVTLKNGTKKKKKIVSMIESDWKDYYGSSEELKKDVETLGSDKFTREIIKYCYSLSELTYYEAREQFVTDCLLHPEMWYNSWIAARVRRDHMIRKKT